MDNPQAFPSEGIHRSDGHGNTWREIQVYPGMTLLDYFAGQALAGNHIARIIDNGAEHDPIAMWCYKTAKSMMKERTKYIKENNK